MKPFILFSSSLVAGTSAIAAAASAPQTPLQPHLQKRPLEDIINASPLLSFHRDIIQIESISGNEYNVGNFVVDFLEARNFTVVKQQVPPPGGVGDETTITTTTTENKSRFNIYAYPADNTPNKSSPGILLTSHIDTVPPFIPYSLSLPDDDDDDDNSTINRDEVTISGRGSVDAKASIAAQIFAALEILSENPDTPLSFLFVVGEEISGDGMKHFSASDLNTAPPTFHTVIFGEPTNAALVAGHKGMLGFDVVATGHAAHSGYPWLGRSAVSAILPALSRVDRLGDIPVEEGGLPSSPKYGKTTLNLGVVRGGVAGNVVPASAQAVVTVRLAAGTPDQAREIISKAVRDATGGDENVYVDFRRHLGAYGPQDLDTDVAGFNVTTVNYGTDVPNLEIHDTEDARVKRYLYGPGSIHVAHGDHEALTVGQLEEAVRGYRRLIDAALARK